MKKRLLAFLYLLSTCAVLATCASPALAKRAAPKAVPPVVANGIEYVALGAQYSEQGRPAGFRASVEARDAKSKKALWKATVYEFAYRPGLETDIQDVHIKSMSLGPKGLLVTNEKDKTYLVDLKTHAASEAETATPRK